MNGVTIDGLHSFEDYGVYLQPKSIPVPQAKVTTVSIQGSDGEIDLSTALTDGNMRFDNREFELGFIAIGFGEGLNETLSRFMAAIHGKNHEFTFDDDPEHFYKGRWEITDREDNKGYSVLTASVSAEPYRYDVDVTTITKYIPAYGSAVSVVASSTRLNRFIYHCIVQLRYLDSTINVTSGAVGFNGEPKSVTREATYENVVITLSTDQGVVLDERAMFVLKIDCELYEVVKYTWEYSTNGGETWIVSDAKREGGTATLIVSNGRQWIVPTITVDEDMNVTFQGVTHQLYAGKQTNANIILRDGDNAMVFEGAGNVLIEYRRGVL